MEKRFEAVVVSLCVWSARVILFDVNMFSYSAWANARQLMTLARVVLPEPPQFSA